VRGSEKERQMWAAKAVLKELNVHIRRQNQSL
jgi:hypothetical protein